MNHIDERIKDIAHKKHFRIPLFGMVIRLILLIALLICGKMACEWSVDQSVNNVPEWKLKQYEKQQLKTLVKQRANGEVSKDQLKGIVDSIETNAKRDYIRER